MQCNTSQSNRRTSGLGGCPLTLASDRDRTDPEVVWPWLQGGFHHSAKQVQAKNTPLAAQKPCDGPRVGRGRAPMSGQGPGEALHFLARCPPSGPPTLCRSRQVLAARDCGWRCSQNIFVRFDEPSATGPDQQTPPSGDTSPQPQANSEDCRVKSREK